MKLQPADIRREWPRIKPAVIEACGSFPYEEVYAACRYGQAALYVCPEGFCVLEQYTAVSDGAPEMNVLLAHAHGEGSMLDAYAGELAEIGRQNGADRVVFRRLKDAAPVVKGWRHRASEYVMELVDGR